MLMILDIEAAGIGDQAYGPQAYGKRAAHYGAREEHRDAAIKALTQALTRFEVFHMIRHHALAVGFSEEIGCHTFRATSITVYRKNGGTLADAQQIAGHSSARTTQLYERSEREISLEDTERIRL